MDDTLAEIKQDRVHVVADAWLTPMEAAEFALRVSQLANQLSADLAGDAEVLAAAGIPVVPPPLDAKAAAEYITVTPSPQMRAAVLAAAGLPDLADNAPDVSTALAEHTDEAIAKILGA